MPVRGRILGLLIAHVVSGLVCLGLVVSTLAGTNPGMTSLALIPFYGIVFCDVILLGIWAAMSKMAWWLSLIGLVAGSVYLDGLLLVAGVSSYHLPVASIASLVSTVLLLLAWRPRVQLIRNSPTPSPGEGLRFSIRGLMLLTLVAALLIFGSEGLGDSYLAILVAWISCFVVVGLASPWAALGLGHPYLKCLVVLAISAAIGALFIFRIYRADIPRILYLHVYSAFLLHAALLIGSLLVVRSCGYRLAEKPLGKRDRMGVAPSLDVERMLQDMGS
jgi:hypothetical protein